LRRTLFAVYKTIQKDDPKDGIAYLRTEFGPDYWANRLKLSAIAAFIAEKSARIRTKESAAADLLAQKLQVDRL
jgi:putative DNA methylase